MYRRGSQSNVLVLFDNLNLLLTSCDSDRPELDLIELLSHLV